MSITILRIELSNIRSHKFITFEPSSEGVTAISGPNGVGKSTLIDSVSWAIYGSKPQGVSKVAAIIREGTQIGKEKCYAKIDLKLDDVELRVERRIVTKNGGVECEVWERPVGTDDSDWKHVAGTAVSHSEPYLRKRLKMDEKGFLAAVLVQQKQVDQLISAPPRERAEVIEKLTGISSITAALTEARKEYNVLRKTLQLTTIDENELEKLIDEQSSLKKDLTAKTQARDHYKKEYDEVTNETESLTAKIEESELKQQKIEELKNSIIQVKASIASTEDELSRIKTMKDNKKKLLSNIASGLNIKEVEKELNSLRTKLRENERTIDQSSGELKKLQETIAIQEEIISKSTIKNIDDAVEGLKKAERQLNRIEAKIRINENESLSHQTEIKSIDSAVRIISKTDGACPTCLQSVADPSTAIEGLNKEKEALVQKIEDLETSKENFRQNRSKAEESISKFNVLVESLTLLDTNKTKILPIQESLIELEKLNVDLTSEVKLKEKAYNNAVRYTEVKTEYDELLKAAVEISDRVEKLKISKKTNEKELEDLSSLKTESLPSLRKKYTTLSTRKNKLFEDFTNLREEVSVLNTKLNHVDEKIVIAEEQAKKYKDLLKSVEVSSNSVEIIEEFREDRIKTSVPVVGSYASELLSRFTEGKFTQLKLDENFNATVVLSSGVERPVGLLSGGELSAAAISLRLAISMLLNSGPSQNALILDEVLVSQDATRAEQILSAIKEVCHGQVIMISHGPHTNEIADKVVEL